MLIFITGATGFIGSHLAARLMSEGNKLRCLARQTSNLDFLNDLGVSITIADISDKNALRQALEGVDLVYHTAAVVGEWLSEKQVREVNIKGTQNLLEASLEAKVKRFVYVSSLAVLGMKHHHNTPPDAPYHLTGDLYSDSKIETEKMVMDFCRRHGLPVSVIRAGFVLGPRDRRFMPRVLKLIKEKKFMFLGNGKNIMNLVYIDNLIDVLIQAGLRKEAVGQIYNVRNKDQVTMKEFITMVCDILGVETPRKSIPLPIAKALASCMEAGSRLMNKKEPPLLTKARVKVSGLNLDFDISKTIEDLNYDSRISIKEGLKKTLISP